VKLDMGFDEALRRLAQTPKKAIAAIAEEAQAAQKAALAVGQLKKIEPTQSRTLKPKAVKR
jgi:hypothetical protein